MSECAIPSPPKVYLTHARQQTRTSQGPVTLLSYIFDLVCFLMSMFDLGRIKIWAGFQRRVVRKVAEDVINVDIVDLGNGITNVLVSGRMDVQGALAVDKKFSTIADEKKKVVIDLSQVTFLASLGIRTLIMSCKTLASKGGDMVLLNPQPNVEKVLRTSGVDTVIQIVRDMNAAAAIFAK